MTKISPIAQYLRTNKAIAKHDKYGCHFISPEGLYLGRLSKSIINNYRVISLDVIGEGLKKLYSQSMALGQRYSYITNESSPIGVSIIPIKSYKRKIFVNYLENTSIIEDSERTLTNKLDLIAIDKNTGTGLFDTDKPFIYNNKIINSKCKNFKNRSYVHTIN